MAHVPIARHLLRARDLADARYVEALTVADMAAAAALSPAPKSCRLAVRLAPGRFAGFRRKPATRNPGPAWRTGVLEKDVRVRMLPLEAARRGTT
ncbi:hypothetical protein [Streptomyces beihaiensis]|uniref:Uncharacterized protein n=1 Tax=Streptomyces beihaiensis TaxID=2984495 RepID=A0ABT3TWE3_9ACTN|nr:hypothetical protein [Streptomyces beihaiensis]MCX3061370.1 hypothetical protein [Streptomyces beihaiensis]